MRVGVAAGEDGGTGARPAQVGAVRELRALVRQAVGETDDRWRLFQARLATAVYINDDEE
jgi:hypothetical protein